MATFALDWLASLYGNDIKRAVKRAHATRWNDGSVDARRRFRLRRRAASPRAAS